MLSRSVAARQAQRSLRSSPQRRGLATPTSFQYQTGEVQGIKFASRDIPGPVATVAIVSQAGTRFQPLPGLAEALQRYAFKVRNSI